MKKTFTTLFVLSTLSNIKAQVTIGNSDATNSTLTVQESNNSNTPDGIIIPFATRTELANKPNGTYGSQQLGTLIYVTNITGGTSGTSSSQITNIDRIGFYYFANDNKWTSVSANSDDFDFVNIYTSNGVLLSERTVELTNNLHFNNNGNNFTVGNSQTDPTLTIKSNNVGILGSGNTTIPTGFPSTNLHINTKSGYGLRIGPSSTNSYILQSDSNGKGTWVQNNFKNTVLGTISNVKKDVALNAISGSSITLTPGVWNINLGRLIKSSGPGTADNNLQIIFSLTSSSTTAGETNNFSFIDGDDEIIGWLAPSSLPNGIGYNTIKGMVRISVTNNVTLYPYVSQLNVVGTNNFNAYWGIDPNVTDDFDEESFLYATFIQSTTP